MASTPSHDEGAGGSPPDVSSFDVSSAVARCPHCDAVLATVVESADKVWLNLSGISASEITKR